MKARELIFSEKVKLRLARHCLFWLAAFLFFISFFFFHHIDNFVHLDFSRSIIGISTSLAMTTLSEHLKVMLINFSIIIIYTYVVTYWVVPRYLTKKRYVNFAVALVLVTISAHFGILFLYGFNFRMPLNEALIMLWMLGLHAVNDGPPIFCMLFLTIKMVKTWYLKDEEEMTLIRENTNAELQLLKAQVHPHFLFNTLNNIYSFALDYSPKAPELVLKLSAMVRYMIYECKAPHVPLEKELKMIRDYIGLEKVRYGKRLQLSMDITGDPRGKQIAPLLLIPFIENCFKHGTSRMIDNSWIRLTVSVLDTTLYFSAVNSKPAQSPDVKVGKGIGLPNVKKRLQLLYPDRHSLLLDSTDDSFKIEMHVPLHPAPDPVKCIDVLSTKPSGTTYVGA